MNEIPELDKRYWAYSCEECLKNDCHRRNILEYNYSTSTGATMLVADKKTKNMYVLVILKPVQNIDSETIETAAHESVHATDALYKILGIGGDDYDSSSRNEHYAYLVGILTVKLLDYISSNLEKEIKDEEPIKDTNAGV